MQRAVRRLRFTRWLWTIGATRRDSLALIASYNSKPVRWLVGLREVASVTARLNANGTSEPFEFREACDFTVLNEVFRQGQYQVEQELQPRQILDLGSHTGMSVLFLHSLFPSARILAVEANPDSYERLVSNARRWSNVDVVHLAATDHDGQVQFFRTKGRAISASLVHRSATDQVATVPSESLSTILARCGGRVDLLKFDIEGAELRVFSSFNEWERLGVMIGEVHPDLYGGTLQQFFDLFPRHRASVLQRRDVRAIVRLDPAVALDDGKA